MLIKVKRGSEPSGLCRYVLDVKKQPAYKNKESTELVSVRPFLLDTNMPGSVPAEFARHFRAMAELNPRVKSTITHYSISLSPDDIHSADQEHTRAITKNVLDYMGHARCPYFAVEHHDSAQKHWHVVVSSISYDGAWVDSSFERYRLRKLEPYLEAKFKLKLTHRDEITPVKNLTTGEYRLKARTGVLVPKEKIWLAIDNCIGEKQTLPQFLLKLRSRFPDVSIRFKELDGKKVGVSFGIKDAAFSGRSLGRGYSLYGLQKYHHILYQPKLQDDLIDRILHLTLHQCQEIYHRFQGQLASSHHDKSLTEKISDFEL